jgi:hypothetical protein
MDKVTRQIGQHIEFDPEWETAFNLVIKVQSIISLILDWCSNDVRKTEIEKMKFLIRFYYRKNYYFVHMK